tara:strand:- start:147 stop:338 length:192 start_codon:yes stop_codon:yes gene_type:complete
MPQGKGTYGSKVGRPSKKKSEEPEDSLTQKPEYSGLGKTLLTSKVSDDSSEDNPMKKKVRYTS